MTKTTTTTKDAGAQRAAALVRWADVKVNKPVPLTLRTSTMSKARQLARHQGTSLSALVADCLLTEARRRGMIDVTK